MSVQRLSGVLLHPTSFSDTPGIGTIGEPAYRFLDWLEAAGQHLWQILPLGPTGYGDSPYASFSTFAGNPLLIDLDTLHDDGFLTTSDLQLPDYIHTSGNVDFGAVVYWKLPLLHKAAESFRIKRTPAQEKAYRAFCESKKYWLTDYATFMDIKTVYDAQAQKEQKSGCRWNNYWPHDLATHKEQAVNEWQASHEASIERHKIIQYFFFTQWDALRNYAQSKNISIIGDIPIFVAADSADVWANQNQFKLDNKGCPTNVAGVPPDYFCATGQLWGNPLYDWDVMEKTNYAWWTERICAMLSLVDYIRIDHFRGFESYWSVPATAETAIDGKWLPGPGKKLFDAVKKQLGDIAILAEDLGIITDKVHQLRDACGFPGMKVLQFAFSHAEKAEHGMANPFLPHMYESPRCIVYTGTHDNDTTKGWLDQAAPEERKVVTDYLGMPNATNDDLVDCLIRLAFSSIAQYAVIPAQDILHSGCESRMNTPATTGANWSWRLPQNALTTQKAAMLYTLSEMFNRNGIK